MSRGAQVTSSGLGSTSPFYSVFELWGFRLKHVIHWFDFSDVVSSRRSMLKHGSCAQADGPVCMLIAAWADANCQHGFTGLPAAQLRLGGRVPRHLFWKIQVPLLKFQLGNPFEQCTLWKIFPVFSSLAPPLAFSTPHPSQKLSGTF